MSGKTYHYLFGPVPSRRLGRSLGLDIVPMKTCSQNCLYCQLCKDAPLTLDRKAYVPVADVLGELRQRLGEGPAADYITLSGSGEPTLHSELGILLDGIKAMTDIPAAVITNGSLLSMPDVRRDCAKADVVLPSLDAGDEATFRRLNNPHPDLSFETFVEGLCTFRHEYPGQIWLEVFFCEGVNTDEDSLGKIARLIDRICPDKIQLNTAVRPTVHAEAVPVQPDRLEQIARRLHPKAEVIADFAQRSEAPVRQATEDDILGAVSRHPCSLDDLCGGLSLTAEQVRPLLDRLLNAGKIIADVRSGKLFFRPA